MTLNVRKAALWLGLVIGLCYLGSISGTYHFDDSHSIQGNLAVRSLANIPSFWTDPRTSSFIPENRVYRPLVYTFYAFCWLAGNGATWPFHIMKMIMHLMVCLALFLIWRRLWSEPGWFPAKFLKIKFPMVSHVFSLTPEWAAFFLAMVFAIHPACSECVDYIAATTSLQCAMFYVWAFYAYLLYRDSGEKKRLFQSLFLFFLSVASKEEGITLPAVVVLAELFLYSGSFFAKVKEAFLKMLPYGALAITFAGWIYIMHPPSGNESRGYVSSFEYFITQWREYLWYMRLWFWPWDLNADSATIIYSKSIFDPLVIQAAIGNLCLLAFSWFNRKRYPAMLFGLLWFYITISPASSVVVLAEAVNEHRMYLSYIGFVGGSLVVLLHWAEVLFAPETRTQRLGWIFTFIIVGLVTGTQDRNRVWANDESLWADTVEKNPTSGRALNNLALVYMARGEYEKAVSLLSQCETYWPTYMYCPLNKGVAYNGMAQNSQSAGKIEDAKKEMAEAEKAFFRAYDLDPRSVHTNFHLGQYYQDIKKDCAKAVGFYRAAIDLTGRRYPDADVRIASCYESMKRNSDATAALKEALSVDPKNEGALFELAHFDFDLGKVADSLSTYEQLLSIDPSHVGGWYNYGVVQVAKGDFSAAKRAFERTVQLDPKSLQGWYNLAFASERLGDGAAALNAVKQLVLLDPQKPEFQSRLHDLEKKFGAQGT